MSLAFLAKKSWHTANLRNVEKVWIAEEKRNAEDKKLAELRKNIEEERQLQELRQLQAAHGKKSAAVERVDWMYEGPMTSAHERTTEEYLLGKEYQPQADGADDTKLGDAKYGALAQAKPALPSNDAFSRLNEDPMMQIRKQQQSVQASILKNPVKMKKIQAEVERALKEKKDRKKAKKQLKSEGKEHKHKHKHKHTHSHHTHSDKSHHKRSETPERLPLQTTQERYRSRSRSMDRRSRTVAEHRGSRARTDSRDFRRRSRSPSFRESSRRDRRSSTDYRGRSRSSSRSQARYRSRRRSRSPSDERHVTGAKRSASTRSPSRDSFGRVRPKNVDLSRRPERDEGRDSDRPQKAARTRYSDDRYDGHRESRHRSPARSRDERRDRERRNSHSRSRSRQREANSKSASRTSETGSRKLQAETKGDYGLISADGKVESSDGDKSSLGPNAKFVQQAREKKREEEKELRRKLSKSSRHEKQFVSHEEMLEKAAQMKADAEAREAYLASRAVERKAQLDEEEQEVKKRKNPQFLQQLQDEAYNKHEGTMEDRLRRNAHYIQKRADASNFMKK